MSTEQRRVGVFLDYWWIYSSARQVFPGPETPAPAWFGNVLPAVVAHQLVKRPPASVRRSQRSLAGLHIFVRHYDTEVHRSQHERVLRWQATGAEVHVGPAREEGGGFWQSSVSVDLATQVVRALERGEYQSAVVFSGDGALLPLFRLYGGDDSPLEVATWVAADGSLPAALPVEPGVWQHRLGEASFRQANDDRRLQRPGTPSGSAKRRRAAASGGTSGGSNEPPAPTSAMAAALTAAGLASAEDDPAEDSRVRRFANRLFPTR